MVEALAHRRGEARISDVLCFECQIIGPLAPLIETWERMRREGCATFAVMDQSKFVRLLFMENIGRVWLSQRGQESKDDPPVAKLS